MQPTLRHTLTEAKRHHIVAAEHGRRPAIDDLIRGTIAAIETVITLNTQRRIKMLPRLLDGIHKTTTTLRGTRLRNIAGDNANTSMTTFQQILGSQTTTKIVVKTDGIAPAALRQTVDQHHRARHKRHILTQLLNSTPNTRLTRRDQHHPIHPTGRKTLQQLMLRSTRIIGIGHNQRIPLRGALILHTLGKRREKQVLNIRQPAGTAWSPSYARSDSAHNSASSPRRQWPYASPQTREPADYSTPAKPSSQTPPQQRPHPSTSHDTPFKPLKTFLLPA